MPHIHLEYSDNVENFQAKSLLLALNQALVDGAYVTAANELKSRAICQHDYVIGLGDVSQAYVHAKVSLLAGCSLELQQQIAQVILHTLEQHIPAQSQVSVQICVEILEMQKATYAKKLFKALLPDLVRGYRENRLAIFLLHVCLLCLARNSQACI